jgi:hypothetical protein
LRVGLLNTRALLQLGNSKQRRIQRIAMIRAQQFAVHRRLGARLPGAGLVARAHESNAQFHSRRYSGLPEQKAETQRRSFFVDDVKKRKDQRIGNPIARTLKPNDQQKHKNGCPILRFSEGSEIL